MELIKKIRQAEAQAKEIVEQARAEVANQAEKNRREHLESFAEAEQQRKKTIEEAVAAAQSEGFAEAEKLKAQAASDRKELHDRAAGKMAEAVAKVTDYLKG